MYIDNKREIKIVDVELSYNDLDILQKMDMMDLIMARFFYNGCISPIVTLQESLVYYHGRLGDKDRHSYAERWMDKFDQLMRIDKVTHIRVIHEGELESIEELDSKINIYQ
jgi:hypothetical protein